MCQPRLLRIQCDPFCLCDDGIVNSLTRTAYRVSCLAQEGRGGPLLKGTCDSLSTSLRPNTIQSVFCFTHRVFQDCEKRTLQGKAGLWNSCDTTVRPQNWSDRSDGFVKSFYGFVHSFHLVPLLLVLHSLLPRVFFELVKD